jgi:hypothetical protein
VQQSKQMQHEPGGGIGGGVNPPLGARRKDYSASVDDLSRMVVPAGHGHAASSRPHGATGTPASSPASAGAPNAAGGSGVVPSSGSHMRTAASLQDMASLAGGSGAGSTSRHVQSAENTPQSSSRAVAPFAHQRASTSFVGGAASSPHDEVESEEKKKVRTHAQTADARIRWLHGALAASRCWIVPLPHSTRLALLWLRLYFV